MALTDFFIYYSTNEWGSDLIVFFDSSLVHFVELARVTENIANQGDF
jgi:hypothetical protein